MMSPGDSGLQQRIINAFINYFLTAETSASAVTTTLASLSAMEQEYQKHDNSSWLGMFASKVPVPFWLIGKDSHLDKIKICKQGLENAQKNNKEDLGRSAVSILLDFFKKSDDWHVAGYVKGTSINMRLTCELLRAAGVTEDCKVFLQKYPDDFIKELAAALGKLSAPQDPGSSMQTTVSALTALEQSGLTAASITPLKDSHKRLLFVVDGGEDQRRRGAPSASPTNGL